ncbi:MAG TPA: hypothetical protein PK239_07090 [Chitinophagales bacterium]|nr:hypothetical protein [Chitinophagales bacterium]HRK27041.1 hypothetical protein [Chitinophagales bacterium]
MSHTKLYILVEGVTDAAFIADLLKSEQFGFSDNIAKSKSKSETHLHPKTADNVLSAEIIIRKLGGWTHIKTGVIHTDIQEKVEQSYTCLLIFDADYPHVEESGFETRKKVIESALPKTLQPHCHLYIMPDNSADGSVENLLRQIVLENIGFDCIEQFVNCMAQFKTITKKELIHQLIYDHIPQQHRPPWNFTSPALHPLTTFFQAHLH